MKTKKVRLDFSAHCSVVVEVPDTENYEDKAIKEAENYLFGNPSVYVNWELDDGGIDDADEDDEPVNRFAIEEYEDADEDDPIRFSEKYN